MAGKRKPPAEKKSGPELVWEDWFWWVVKGKKRENVGRSRRYAEKLLAERQ